MVELYSVSHYFFGESCRKSDTEHSNIVVIETFSFPTLKMVCGSDPRNLLDNNLLGESHLQTLVDCCALSGWPNDGFWFRFGIFNQKV